MKFSKEVTAVLNEMEKDAQATIPAQLRASFADAVKRGMKVGEEIGEKKATETMNKLVKQAEDVLSFTSKFAAKAETDETETDDKVKEPKAYTGAKRGPKPKVVVPAVEEVAAA
jgi:hypothetical protein